MEQLISFQTAELCSKLKLDFQVEYWYTPSGQLTFKEDSIPAITQAHLQTWLRNDKKILVLINPIDSWNSWTYTMLVEDIMTSFFEPDYDKFNEFSTYEDALEEGLKVALQILD